MKILDKIKNKKIFIVLLMVVIFYLVITSICNQNTFAATTTLDISANGNNSLIATIITSSAGDTITISGQGEMKEEPFANTDISNVVSVAIQEGVTNIGKKAFINFEKLEQLQIAESVTVIGESAFLNCESLTEVEISSNVVAIGDKAFSNCTKLRNIEVNTNNTKYTSVSGILFNKNQTELMSYPPAKASDEYTVPETVRTIKTAAFYGAENLKNIVLSNNLEIIQENAFSLCKKLETINIPSKVSDIQNYAFSPCESLTSINVDSGNIKYTSIDGVLFNKEKTEILCYPGKKEGNSYSVPESVKYIGHTTFYGAKNLVTIILPESVEEIKEYAFMEATSLKHVKMSEKIKSIGYGAFAFCTSLESIKIPESVTTIGEYTFDGCSNLKILVIPNSVTNIGFGAFAECPNLAYAIIPEGVTTIGEYLFYGSTNVTVYCKANSVIESYAKENSIKYENYIAYEEISKEGNGSVVAIVRENGILQFIGSGEVNDGKILFNNSDAQTVTTVEIPANISNISGKNLAALSNLATITVDSNNSNYSVVDGVLFNKDKTTLIKVLQKATYNIYVIPDNVVTIGKYAFCGCQNINMIIVSDTVKTIEEGAFYNCKNLGIITIPEGVESIGDKAF